MGFDFLGMKGATRALIRPYEKSPQSSSREADRHSESATSRVMQIGNVTIVEPGTISSGSTNVLHSDPLTDPRHPDARAPDHNRRTLDVDLAIEEHDKQLDAAKPTLYTNGPRSLNIENLSILQKLGPPLGLLVIIGTLGALLNVQCGGNDKREAIVDPATKTVTTPRTCAEGNRATEINIRNRRIQLLSGVDTVYLVCRGKGRTEQFIGRCIFSEASVPGPLSRPRNVQEAVDKIQLLDQETQATYCRPAALNIVNWANNYNFDQDEIVVPSIVRFEEVDPKNP